MKNLLVWSVLYYLRFWARLALVIHKPFVIGIAGSVGKSSTRNALYAALKDHFRTKVVAGNSETGVPFGILGLPIEGFDKKNWVNALLKAPFGITNLKKVQYLIVEMGIDDPDPPKNMSYLLTIVKPDMAIDLNATATHTAQFEKLLTKRYRNSLEFLMQKIAEEDSKIITNGYTKLGIYNSDDKLLSKCIEKNSNRGIVTLLTFGKGDNNTITSKGYEITSRRTKYTFLVDSKNGRKVFDLTFPNMILPPASAEGFSAVILACKSIGLTYAQIKESLEKNFTLPKGRSTILTGIKDSILIDSSYNSSKSTVLSFLKLIKDLKDKTKRPTVFLMGDMRELGNEAKREHEEVAHEIAKVVDYLYCVGPLTQEYVVPVVRSYLGRRNRIKQVVWYKNAVQAGLHLKDELPKQSIVLIKGSQNTLYLEEAIKFLLENSSDSKFLTRQEPYWQKVKQKFFSI